MMQPPPCSYSGEPVPVVTSSDEEDPVFFAPNVRRPAAAAPPPGRPLRRGRWTIDEERYAEAIIHHFELGLLPLPAGTTLRNHLSECLHCGAWASSTPHLLV